MRSLILMGSPRGVWPCIVRPGFPTIDHDMNLSNTVKLLSRILFLQLIAGSIEKYNRNGSSDTGVRSVRRLPKTRRKSSPAISAAACNFQIVHRAQIGRVIENAVVVVRWSCDGFPWHGLCQVAYNSSGVGARTRIARQEQQQHLPPHPVSSV